MPTHMPARGDRIRYTGTAYPDLQGHVGTVIGPHVSGTSYLEIEFDTLPSRYVIYHDELTIDGPMPVAPTYKPTVGDIIQTGGGIRGTVTFTDGSGYMEVEYTNGTGKGAYMPGDVALITPAATTRPTFDDLADSIDAARAVERTRTIERNHRIIDKAVDVICGYIGADEQSDRYEPYVARLTDAFTAAGWTPPSTSTPLQYTPPPLPEQPAAPTATAVAYDIGDHVYYHNEGNVYDGEIVDIRRNNSPRKYLVRFTAAGLHRKVLTTRDRITPRSN